MTFKVVVIPSGIKYLCYFSHFMIVLVCFVALAIMKLLLGEKRTSKYEIS